MVLGQVRAVSVRARRAAPPRSVDRVLAVAGHGLEGDVHADPGSPRQLLLAGASVYESLALPAHVLRENLLVDLDTA